MLTNILLYASGLVTKSKCHVDLKSWDVCFGDNKIGDVFVGKLQLILTNI